MFVKEMAGIATFDFVDNTDVFDWMLTFPPENDEANLSGAFTDTGYNSRNMVALMGLGWLIFVVLVVVMIVLLITNPLKKYCVDGRCKPLNKLHKKVSRTIFWNFWLRYFIEDCLSACICVCCYLFSSNLSSQ